MFFPARTRFLLILIVLSLIGTPNVAALAESDPQISPISLWDWSTHVVIDNDIEYLIERYPLRPSEAAHRIQWTQTSANRLNFGNLHPPVWLRFDLINKSEADRAWWLEVGSPMLDSVEVVLFNHATGEWHSRRVIGNLIPVEDRPLQHRHFLFPLPLAPGELNTVYMRVETRGTLLVTLDLWQQSAFLRHEQLRILLLGLFFGILIVMCLYNWSLYFFTRDSSYLYYSIYVFFIIFYALAETGLGTQYIWSQTILIKRVSYPLFASLTFVAAGLFIRRFLALKQEGGWVYHTNTIVVTYWGITATAFLFYPHALAIKSLVPMATISCLLAIITGVYLWIKGNASAKYFTIAWAFLLMGTILHVLMMNRTIGRNLVTEYSQMVGFVLEVVLLSFALAERINRERKIREQAQSAVLDLTEKISRTREEKLMVQEQVLAFQRRDNEALELRVLDRTNELERAMKNLEMANKELSKMSFTDPMTNLCNRRYFDKILISEISRAARTRQPVSIIIADIDRFKQVNDVNGHLIGDECLRAVATTLSLQLGRTSDLIARYGGEEFAIVLPATSPLNAMVVADRARAAVEKINLIHRGKRIHLSVSLGVAGGIPEQGESPARFIALADKALYEAKRTGRNRVVASEAVAA